MEAGSLSYGIASISNVKKIQAEHWPWLTVNDTFKSNKKKSTINKIIKLLGHCSLASLQPLDDKRLPSRVTSEIYTLYSDIEWKEHIG